MEELDGDMLGELVGLEHLGLSHNCLAALPDRISEWAD